MVFAYCYLAVVPMMLGVLSRLDSSGQMNGVFYVLAVAGIAAGPSISGWVIAHLGQVSGISIIRITSAICLAGAAMLQTLYAFQVSRQIAAEQVSS